jgi:hypothetical protein
MTIQRIGTIMHGVTGRMGYNQHLIRSIKVIIQDGGLLLPNGDRLLPDPILVGRSAEKVEALARGQGIGRWSDNIEKCLANKDKKVFFDAGITQMRMGLFRQAIQAGDSGRQRHLLRETVCRYLGKCAYCCSVGSKTGGETWGRTGQTLLAGTAKVEIPN